MTTTTRSPAAFLLNMYNQRHSDLIGHPDSIAPTETVWHNNVHNWNFLAGITQPEVTAHHSMPNLLSSWMPKGQKQIISHHSFPNNTIRMSEGTLLAGHNILKFLNSIEVDVMRLQDTLITAHDFKITRTTFRDEPIQWEQLTYDEIKGEPIIVREVDGDRLSPKFQVTSETITKMDEYIVFFIQCNPNVTIFLDCHNKDAAPAIALLSHLLFVYKNCVIELYAYSFSSAQELIAAVKQYQPDQAWRSNIALMVVVSMGTLPWLAQVEADSCNHKALINGGLRFIQSFFEAQLRVMSISLPLIGCTNYIMPNSEPACVVTSYGEVTKKADIAQFMQDYALRILICKVHQQYPKVAITGVCCSYNYKDRGIKYNFTINGEPKVLAEGLMRVIRERQGDITHNIKLFDWIISDLPVEQLEALAFADVGQEYNAGTKHGWYLTIHSDEDESFLRIIHVFLTLDSD